MASVEKLEQGFAQYQVMTVDMERQQNLIPLLAQYQQQRKWLYVLSENLQPTHPLAHCILMRKPEQPVLLSWLKKLIKCGHAGCILVQDLQLDESDYRVIKMLCVLYKVTLINLRHSGHSNLVYGPW